MTIEHHICIVTQSHLCRNPRVLKEALSLAMQGFKVTVLTAIYSDALLQEDLELLKGTLVFYEFYSDLRRFSLSSLWMRFVRKTATKIQSTLHIESVLSLGFNPGRLLKKCVSYNADLYIMHQELPTYIGVKLRKKGRKIAFDIEDWYSEDLLLTARKNRPIRLLKLLEWEALHKGVYCTTTSIALSDKLALAYSSAKPEVIYNVFMQTALPDKKTFNKPLKLFWFSQTIGPGRGLETFMHLLTSVQAEIQLHILGNVSLDYKEELQKLIPEHHSIYFHELVREKELIQRIARFDIGLALELQDPPSRNYTITNKFFQYLQAGLPVIASYTEGQNEGFDKFKPGFKLSKTPGHEEIEKLNKWLNNPAALVASREKALAAAEYYNWENESKKLIKLVNETLQ